ncbi:MAG: tetratricopeptide repeat protein [Myxococcales bacterium]|nr:tetratricopeptide repeat protein [Myxococcales bacterium]
MGEDSLRTLFSSLESVTPSSDTIRQSVRARLFGEVPPSQQIGRYVIQRHLGAGGMGTVFLAHDPKLRRPVAIKLLHQGDARPTTRERRRRRLLREAHGLARLSHPNVVQVHDVDTFGEHLFLVMDHVDGCTLKEWLEAEPRSWREILEVFRQAGEGLEAAHSAGLIHRDFKPSNVLIGRGGRAQVIDFGLVRVDDLHTSSSEDRTTITEEPEPFTGEGEGEVDDELTAPGAVLGTLAYIAPEVFSGAAADARADVYSFSVSLFEALYGVRPFRADSRDLMICQIIEGRIQPPPSRAGVPSWLYRVCLRGLATDPSRRYPTIAALLADLSPTRQLRRRLTPLAAGLVGALVTAGAVANVAARAHESCPGGQMELWDTTDRQAVRAAIAGAGLHDPQRAWSQIDAVFTAHGQELKAVAASLCAEPATLVVATATSRRCLATVAADHRDALGRIIAGELVAITSLVDDPTSLPSPALCLRPTTQEAPAVHAALSLDASIGEVDGMIEDGRYREALEGARQIQADAEAVGAHTQEALAWHLRGRVEAILGDPASSESLAMAQVLAVRAGDERLARRAQIDRARALATLRGAVDEAEGWLDRSRRELRAELGPLDDAHLSAALAEVARVRGDLPEARRQAERALRIRERLLGEEHPLVSEALGNLAAVIDLSGETAAAIDLYRRALDLRERTLRPDHPLLAATLSNLAGALAASGAAEEADSLYARALEIDRAAFGEEHLRVAALLHNRGVAARTRGDDEAAVGYYEEALRIRRLRLGRGDLQVAETLNALAIVDRRRGELERARSEYEEALAIRERALGESHPLVASTLGSLANLHLKRGEVAEADLYLRRAQALYEAQGSAGEVDLAWILRLRGKAEQASGRLDAARLLVERAVLLDRATLGAPGQAEELARAEALLAELTDAAT